MPDWVLPNRVSHYHDVGRALHGFQRIYQALALGDAGGGNCQVADIGAQVLGCQFKRRARARCWLRRKG